MRSVILFFIVEIIFQIGALNINRKHNELLDNGESGENIDPKIYNGTQMSQNSKDILFGHWSKGIVPYFVDKDLFDDLLERRLTSVMRYMESVSCVKFRALEDKPVNAMMWLYFTNPNKDKECVHSPINNDDGQVVVIIGSACIRRHEILHAILHGLGFKDEVTHPFRDQFIRVLWENIHPEFRILFRINTDDYGTKTQVEYDPLSVMHFHDRAFSNNGRATTAAVLPGLQIRPSEELSQLDKMKLNLLFGQECNRRKVDDLMKICVSAMQGTRKNSTTTKKSTN